MTSIVTERRANALKVPIGALFREGADWAVYIVDGARKGGRARLRRIEVGARNTLEAEIVKGVAEGDLVIVHPGDEVADGVRVAARE